MPSHLTASRLRGLRPLRDPQRLRLAAAGAAIVLVAILGGLALQPGSSPGSSSNPGSSGPITWTGAPNAPSPGAWARFVPGPVERLADLTATNLVGTHVATTSRFVLRALGAVSAADLAAAIRVEPEVALVVTPGPTQGTVSLEPRAPLRDGIRYRFRLYAPDGALAGTWAFRTEAPLRIIGRLPDNQTSGVPVETGIEVAFDQDDVVDFAAHFSISPTVEGRFEQHEATWVFVPTKPLANATVYRVTISRGLGRSGSDRVLEADSSWEFQTEASGSVSNVPTPGFDSVMTESRVGESPVVVIRYGASEGERRLSTWPYELYRLPTVDAAAAAVSRLQSGPDWICCDRPASGVVDTSTLTRVAAGDASIEGTSTDYFGDLYDVRLPIRPDEGWYVLVLLKTGQPTQTVLQVTDVAAFVQTTDTRTVTWLSDLRTQAPIAGASVSIHDGATLGVTDSHGVLVVPTPPALITAASETEWVRPKPHVLTIQAPDGRGIVADVGMESGWGHPPQQQLASRAASPESLWWLLLSTDRSTYRSDDVIHAWGIVRARDGLAVPTSVELRFEPMEGTASAAIQSVSASPTARGVFSTDLPIQDVPNGNYNLALYVDGQRLQSQWLEIATIRKPAYRIDLSSDRHVYVAGDPIEVAGEVAFFDGSHAPGMAIRSGLQDTWVDGVTDADGRFTASFTATWNKELEPAGWDWGYVTSVPATPEEGSVNGDLNVLVFPASVWLSGEAALAGDRLSLHATLSKLDTARVEAQFVNGEWDYAPAGAGLANRSVAVKVVHVIPVRTQIGTAYDFIAKVAKPVYRYSTREEVLSTRTLTTDSNGRISLGLGVPSPSHEYQVQLSARDARDRLIRLTLSASQRNQELQPWSYPYLVGKPGCGPRTVDAGVGESISISAYERDGTVGRDGQYLFLIGERGLADVVRQSSATLRRTFDASDLPGYEVRAVRLLPSGYQVLNEVWVRVDPADKTMSVTLTSQRARYGPGDPVTIAVRTLGPDGHPMAADVIVRAVDEKLFAIGGALDVDVTSTLMQSYPAGFLQSFASHQPPYVFEGGCGGGGGDGGRGDFRDSATFQRITTGGDGRGSVTFTAPDDLTSWHVSASAVSAGLDSGSASILVPVGLPFFVDAVMAPEYLAGERPILVVRAYGDAIHARDGVMFSVRSPDLGLAPITVTGQAFVPTSISLPTLAPGRHSITIEASAGAGGLSDRMIRTIVVEASRLGRLEQDRRALQGTLTPQGGPGLTSYLITDAGRGSLVPILTDLAFGAGARVDQALAASVARRLLVDDFSVDDAGLPPDTFDMSRYQRSGVGLLPYASPDASLTAMVALAAPETLTVPTEARLFLQGIVDSYQGVSEQRVVAMAGIAAMGGDVVDELREVDRGKLQPRGLLWLGLGLLASGDEAGAREIERSLLAEYGQELGPWIRLETGVSPATTLQATSLMLVLAGGLGDDAATGLQAYLASQPSTERVFPLETIAYVRSSLERLPRTAGRFAWSVAGVRQEVALQPGGAFSLLLTAQQRASFQLERLSGDLVVATTWTGPSNEAALPSTPGLTITRTVLPGGVAPRDHLVRVTLKVTFGSGLPSDSYAVSELTPSGLAPLAATGTWPEDTAEPSNAIAPFGVDGQRVSWILTPGKQTSFTLTYSARVVSPGAYLWEPATVQSVTAPSLGAHTTTGWYTIE